MPKKSLDEINDPFSNSNTSELKSGYDAANLDNLGDQGDTAYKDGQFEKAIRYYNNQINIIKYCSDDLNFSESERIRQEAKAYVNRALAYYAQKKVDEAIEDCYSHLRVFFDLSEKNSFSANKKADIFDRIQQLPHPLKMLMLKEALNENTLLRHILNKDENVSFSHFFSAPKRDILEEIRAILSPPSPEEKKKNEMEEHYQNLYPL